MSRQIISFALLLALSCLTGCASNSPPRPCDSPLVRVNAPEAQADAAANRPGSDHE